MPQHPIRVYIMLDLGAVSLGQTLLGKIGILIAYCIVFIPNLIFDFRSIGLVPGLSIVYW